MRNRRWIFALTLLLALTLSVAHAENYLSGYTYAAIAEANVERARYGLSELEISPALMEAARVRCEEIQRKFSHTRPDGTSWRTVSPAVYAENIARGHNNPDRVTAAWMTSAGHRRNILHESYRSIGMCCMKLGNVCYWVQLFGK